MRLRAVCAESVFFCSSDQLAAAVRRPCGQVALLHATAPPATGRHFVNQSHVHVQWLPAETRSLLSQSPPPPAPPVEQPPMTLADYQQLAAGTGELNTAPYYMSGHYLHGQAMALAVPPGGTSPLISANKYGRGRLLHAGHENILFNSNIATSGLGALMKNAALWASSNKAAGIRVAGSESGLTSGLVQQLANSVCVPK